MNFIDFWFPGATFLVQIPQKNDDNMALQDNSSKFRFFRVFGAMLAAKIVQLGVHLATLRGQEGVSKWVYVRPWSGMVKKVKNMGLRPSNRQKLSARAGSKKSMHWGFRLDQLYLSIDLSTVGGLISGYLEALLHEAVI